MWWAKNSRILHLDIYVFLCLCETLTFRNISKCLRAQIFTYSTKFRVIRPLLPLIPEDWYGLGQGVRGGIRNEDGIWLPVETDLRWFLWVPPPALADVALEELTKSRHKKEPPQPYLHSPSPCDTPLEKENVQSL